MEGGSVRREKQGPGKLKGRPVDPQALAEVQALLGDEPRSRELLIEHLHRIQDRYGFISAAHAVALAREMRLAPTEVYEVATFYHHFDVVKEGTTPPPPLTVRVCDSLSCELAGGAELFEALKKGLGDRVRVKTAPCVGRCEQAPVAIVARNPVPNATPDKVMAQVNAGATECPTGDYIDYAHYRASGGYALAAEVVSGKRDA